jgi:energy-coupling factor transport system permease protein
MSRVSKSPLLKLHPTTKILCLLIMLVEAMVFNHPLYLAPLLALVIVICILALAVPRALSLWKFYLVIALAAVILWSLFLDEPGPGYNLLGRHISLCAVLYGIGMAERLIALILFAVAFSASTPIEAFTYGLRRLGLPYRVGFSLSLAFRLVPSIYQTARMVETAQRARGYDFRSQGFFHKIVGFVPLMIPTILYTLRNANNLSLALECKGFGLKRRRTSYVRYHFGWGDVLALALFVSILTISLWLRLHGYGAVVERL